MTRKKIGLLSREDIEKIRHDLSAGEDCLLLAFAVFIPVILLGVAVFS